MMKRQSRRYLSAFLGVAFAIYALLGAFNFVVDPYGLFPGPEITGFNEIKADVDKHVRMVKAFQVRQSPPTGLIVGSSRALLGVPSNHAAWPKDASPVYNLSLYGGYLYEAMRYFEHAVELGSVRHTLLALDFWMFDRDWVTRSGFSEERLLTSEDGVSNAPDDLEPLRTLFAWDTLRSSLRTITRQDRDDILVQQPDGSSGWRSEAGWLRTKKSHLQQFGYMERMFGVTAWKSGTPSRWDVTDPADQTSPLQMFRRMVRLAHDKKIDLRITISPSHARIWEVMYAGGMWQTWEDWKRALVQITLEEAARVNASPFPVWDFSGHNSITTEPVPRDGSPMKWYTDGSHFKPNLGAIMLERIYTPKEKSVPPDFGILLAPGMIDEALGRLRISREIYARTHPVDVKEASRWAAP